MIHYKRCPSCGSEKISEVFLVKDYTVSQKSFPVWACADCGLRFTQNVPAKDEIGPYYKAQAYVSHTDSKQGIVNNIYHRVRNYTLRKKLGIIRKFSGLSHGSILDVGSGTGSFLATMKSAGWQVTGIEPDDTAVENSIKLHGINPKTENDLYTFNKESFDVITMWHVLEHVHDLHKYLQAFQNILKPGGKLIIAVPNYTSLDAKLYGQYWAAWDVPRHLYHFSPKSMKVLLQKHGFNFNEMLPMKFDSTYVSMLSEPMKNGKGNIVRAFVNGMRSNLHAGSKPELSSSVIYLISKA